MSPPSSSLFGDRWLWAGASAVAFFTLGADAPPLVPDVEHAAATPGAGADSAAAELTPGGCPPGTAPDGDACVHLTRFEGGPVADAQENTHRDRSGRWATYEQIPRLPERPASYDLYRYPIPPGLPGGRYVVSGYDLDQPNDRQRRGATLKHVGHGAVDLPQARGTPVAMIALEHQEGDAEVLFTGRLFGTTVLTRHTLREGGRLRDYVMLLGHLDSVAPGVVPGRMVKEGEVVGAVGDSGSPSLVHLHLEIRRVREGVDLAKVASGPAMVNEAVSVVCDPRNVLPLR